MEDATERSYIHLSETLAAHGVDVEAVEDRLRSQRVDQSLNFAYSGVL